MIGVDESLERKHKLANGGREPRHRALVDQRARHGAKAHAQHNITPFNGAWFPGRRLHAPAGIPQIFFLIPTSNAVPSPARTTLLKFARYCLGFSSYEKKAGTYSSCFVLAVVVLPPFRSHFHSHPHWITTALPPSHTHIHTHIRALVLWRNAFMAVQI